MAAYDTHTGRQEHLLFVESLEQAHSLAREQAPLGWMLVEVRPNMDLDSTSDGLPPESVAYCPAMATFLHTMVRITDPERSRGFYEALGFRFSNEMDIVREGELEATNYFYSSGEAESVLELTYNHDGRTYEMGTAYGHIAIGVDDLDATLGALKDQHGIEPERPPYQVREGGSRICFVRDPDSYRVELIERRG